MSGINWIPRLAWWLLGVAIGLAWRFPNFTLCAAATVAMAVWTS